MQSKYFYLIGLKYKSHCGSALSLLKRRHRGQDFDIKEVGGNREWILYPKGQEPIRLIVDKRMKPISRCGPVLKAGAICNFKKREIRVAPKGVSATAIGHEVGHIILKHGEGEDQDKPSKLDSNFIREELEAEYWSYTMDFPKREYKIKDLRGLAGEIGITRNQFNKLHEMVKRRFKR